MLKNLFVNILARLISSLSILVLIPIYIRIIGEKGYAVIALYTMILGIVTFASSSFSAVILREMSITSFNKVNEQSIVITLERILFSVLLFFLIGAVLLKNIALEGAFHEVDNAEQIYPMVVLTALMFLAFNFYVNAIFGKDQQVLSNVFLVLAIISKAIVGITVLLAFEGDLLYFFISQALVDCFYTISARYTLLIKVCSEKLKGKFDSSILRRNIKFSAGLTLISIIAAINMQVDKVLVSDQLGLLVFSAYAAAASLAIIPIMLASIIGRSFYPKLVQSVVGLELSKTVKMTVFSIRLYMMSCLLIITCFKLLEPELLQLWLGDNSIKLNVAQFFPLIFLSSLLIGIQVFIYNIVLAFKNTKINILLGSANALTVLFLMPYIIDVYGVIYMLCTYIALNFLISFLYVLLVFLKYKIPSITQLLIELLLMLSLVGVVIMYSELSYFSETANLLSRIFISAICCGIYILASFKQRTTIQSF